MVISYEAMPNPVSFRYFKTSPEIIQLAVMLYVRFPQIHSKNLSIVFVILFLEKNVSFKTGLKNALEIGLFTVRLQFIFISGEESYQTVCYRSHWLVLNSLERLKGKGKMLGLISLTAPFVPLFFQIPL